MAKVMIVEMTENGIEVAETNVPFSAIEKFCKEYKDEDTSKDKSDKCADCKYHNEFECIMATKYPEFYKQGKDEGVYDGDFFEILAEMAGEMGYGPEEMVDGLVLMATKGSPMDTMLMATAVVIAKKKHFAKKKEQ